MPDPIRGIGNPGPVWCVPPKSVGPAVPATCDGKSVPLTDLAPSAPAPFGMSRAEAAVMNE